MLILILAFGVAALAHRYLQMYAPSNAIVARVRQERPRLRVAAGLLVLAAALACAAILLSRWAAAGGPGWLNLVVLIAIWDAMKFTWVAFLAPAWLLAAVLRGPDLHPSGPTVTPEESSCSPCPDQASPSGNQPPDSARHSYAHLEQGGPQPTHAAVRSHRAPTQRVASSFASDECSR